MEESYEKQRKQYPKVGEGGLWIKEGKKGKFFSWKITFAYSGHQITARGRAFKNERKEGNQSDYLMPDYLMKVMDAFPSKAIEMQGTQPKREPREVKPKVEEDIPF